METKFDSAGLSETRSKLRSSLDDIASQIMLADAIDSETVHSWIGVLQLLSESAAEYELGEVSELIADLVHTLPQGVSTPILDSITKLQEALSRSEQTEQASGQVCATTRTEPPTERAEQKSYKQSVPSSLLASDPELIAEFILESRDHLSSLEGQLLALESAASTDTVHSIFRSFHTIKGLAGFLDLPAIQIVAHQIETLLELARGGQLRISGPVVDVILASADYLNQEIDRVEAQLEGKVPSPARDSGELIRRVQSLMGPSFSEEPLTAPPDAVERAVDPVVLDAAAGRSFETEAARFIKIDMAKLDFLVDMVGELVIAQSILRHDEYLANAANPRLQRNLAQLSRITADVQKTAMSMRMVPIGQLFRRSVRLVRDLTRKLGKQAELKIAGEDTELDRTLVEELADPLMHMIRNAADHGVEPPAERIANGKNPVANISLKAFHQSGHITIQLSDDGRGLDRERILRKAAERGLVPLGYGAKDEPLKDTEVFNLIFEPGFSTAEKITDLSGRGVGMDVVLRQVQKLRGRIEIESTLGQGTTFSIKLPLTLAIIDGLVVAVGKERYVIPIYAVREMFRPSPEKVFTVEGKAEMLLVRGSLLPVVRLHRMFGIVPKSRVTSASLVVVAESGQSRFCLLVDDMLGKQEVVIKSLGETLKNVRGIAGGAILGDGRVGLVLDIDAVYGDRAYATALS